MACFIFFFLVKQYQGIPGQPKRPLLVNTAHIGQIECEMQP